MDRAGEEMYFQGIGHIGHTQLWEKGSEDGCIGLG